MSNDKQPIIDFLNHYLSIGTIIGGVIAIIWIGMLLYVWKTKKRCLFLDFVTTYALPTGFLVSLVGSLLSLYYSDYLGILPCGLCWFQRVFLYSQVFLFGIAWHKNDRKIFDYTLILSIMGLIVSTYHSYLQMGYSELLPCPVVASTIDCAKPTFVEFGFVTFPLMGVALFSLLILLSVTSKRFHK